MNEEKKINRKDWIKNAAIVFLSVMLVLTFFSNTILNYSLPEVATVMIEPGSVTSRIRGTGTLTSEDPYKVTIQESRVVAGVAVKQGDTVEKGQVLFYLEDKESTELKEAEGKLRTLEAELDALVLAYSTSLLKGEVSPQSYQNIQSGMVQTDNTYQARIDASKQKVSDLQATVDNLNRQISIAGTGVGNNANKSAELTSAETALQSASDRLAAAKSQLQTVEEKLAGSSDEVQLTEDLSKARDKEQIYLKGGSLPDGTADDGYETNYNELKKAYGEVFAKIPPDVAATLGMPEIIEEPLYQPDGRQYLNDCIARYDEAKAEILKQSISPDEYEKIKDLFKALSTSYNGYVAARAEADSLQTMLDQRLSISAEATNLRSAVNSAQNHYNECKAKVDRLKAEVNNNTASLTQQKAELETAKINAEQGLKQAQAELNQLLTDISSELNFSGQNDVIRIKQDEVARQREEVQKLIEKSQGTTIVAPVAGIVTGINITAGETASPDRELAVMQPEGKGFSMSFSVTNEQAQKVRVGDPAELQNAWYYGDVTASLTAIRPDPNSPGQKKLLVFSVKGEVQSGQSISLVVGQKSANYDMIVPNSAIREDNNGKFILVVESRNSPLGNRYIATRYGVEVLATDDLNSAITVPLYGYEYVITTATKPVEAGRQVRLAESK